MIYNTSDTSRLMQQMVFPKYTLRPFSLFILSQIDQTVMYYGEVYLAMERREPLLPIRQSKKVR